MLQAAHRLCLLTLLLLLGTIVPGVVAAQATALPELGSPAFIPVWGRTDYPVADGKVQRAYYFGPSAIVRCPEEAYAQAPSGARLVTYLDKARLELPNPAAGTVTSGLLARELISGKLQLGDDVFRALEPAAIPVAGDPVESAAPTYASFARVATLDGAQNRAPRRLGLPVTQTLNRGGQVEDDAGLSRYGVTLTEYRDELGHNIPNVFADFFKRRGTVATISVADGKIAFVEDQQLIDWVAVMGLPLAEPHWAQVPIGGTTKWVLVQPYERRVITYTPDNDEAFRVEMGNIGRHYQTWRHPDGTCAERPAAPPADDVPPPPATNTLLVKITPTTGPAYTEFVFTIGGWESGESVAYWFTDPTQGVWYPHNRQIQLAPSVAIFTTTLKPSDAFQTVTPGLWSFTAQGVNSGRQGIAYFRILDSAQSPAATPATAPDESPYDGTWVVFSSYLDDALLSVDRGSVREITGLVRNGNCRVRFQQTFTHEQGLIDGQGRFLVRAEWEKFGIAFAGVFGSPEAVKGTGEFDIRTSGCRGKVGFGWEGRPERKR